MRERLVSLLNVDVSGIRGEEDGMVLETASNRTCGRFSSRAGTRFSSH